MEGQIEGQDMPCWDQVWDGDFLPADPYQAYMKGSYSKVDYLSGITTNEGFVVVAVATPELLAPSLDIAKAKEGLTLALRHAFGRSEDIDKLVMDVLGEDLEKQEADVIRQKISHALGEYSLVVPSYLAAQLHSANVPNSYFYEFAHQPSFAAGHRPSWHRGCDHLLEMTFVFGLPLVDNFLTQDAAPMTEEECTFSRVVMKYIANFVRNGNPNREGLPQWNPFAEGSEHYQILQPDIDSGKNPQADVMKFWGQKVRGIRKQDVKEDKPDKDKAEGKREEL